MQKKKLKFIAILSIILVQSLFVLLNNSSTVKAADFQDDTDLDVTLHCRLTSNSAEILSSLMPIGTYNFFETPQLDVSDYSLDYERIDFSQIQEAIYNETEFNHFELNGANSTVGNKSLTFESLPGYSCDGSFDTMIQFLINYTSLQNSTNYFFTNFTSGFWDLITIDSDELIYVEREGLDGDCYADSFYSYDTHNSVDGYLQKLGTQQKDFIFKEDLPYLLDNYTQASTISLYYLTTGISGTYRVYPYSDFNEATLTWNNAPAITEPVQYEGYLPSGSDPGYHTITLDEPQQYYRLRQVTTDTGCWVVASEHGTNPNHPIIKHYVDKLHQENGLLYMQSDENENLKLKSIEYSERVFDDQGLMNLTIQTNSENEINLQFLNNDEIVDTYELVADGNSDFTTHIITITSDSSIIFDQLQFEGDFEDTQYFKCFNISMFPKFFNNIVVDGFNYTVNNLNYTQSIAAVYDKNLSSWDENNGTYVFYIDSSMLLNRDIADDLIIPSQNLSLIMFFTRADDYVNFSVKLEYSTNVFRVPSEINLTLNSDEIIDESINSGYVSLTNFAETFDIDADLAVYFSLNITCLFTFSFNLEIISKTYLRKSFKLLTDHEIEIEQIDLPSELNIKKIYLNNIDHGSENPCVLTPSVSMDTNNIYKLEVILADSIYIPLSYVYNTLGTGTSQLYLAGISNALSYNDIDRVTDLDINLPSGFNSEYANLSFSNINYKQHYDSDLNNNTFAINQESQNYIQPSILCENSSTTLNSINITESTIPTQPFSLSNGTIKTTGDIGEFNDNSFTKFNSTIYPTHHDGTYSFTYEAVGSNPAGWVLTEQSGCTVNIYGTLLGHKKTLEFSKVTGIQRDAHATNDFTDQTSGTVEFWICTTTSISYGSAVGLRDQTAAKWATTFGISGGFLYYYSFGSVVNYIKPAVLNCWYHVKMTFNTNTDLYDLTISNSTWTQTVTGITFAEAGCNSIDRIYINTDWSPSQVHKFYIDAVGYSWTTNKEIRGGQYNVNDNKNSLTADLNITSTIQMDGINQSIYQFNQLKVYYAFNLTNYNKYVRANITIYNYQAHAWDTINKTIYTGSYFYKIAFIANSSHFNTTNHVLINFVLKNATTEFSLCLDLLTLNYTFIWYTQSNLAPSLSIIYKNPCYVNDSFNTTIIVSKTSFNISKIWFYDNKTLLNRTIGSLEGTYNITLSFTTRGFYTIIAFVNDTKSNYRMINITNLFVAKRAFLIDILNLKSSYNQNETIIINATMRDCNNNALTSKSMNCKLTNQTDNLINQTALTTNAFGSILFYFESNFTTIGFYHINFTFNSNQYLNYSKMMSFELIPFEHSVNSTDINLQVNSNVVINNFVQINYTSTFVISCDDNSTFDLNILFKLNYTQNIAYSSYLDYLFTFNASSSVNYITFTTANISNCPSNFTNYYYNNLETENYVLTGSDFEIFDLISEVFYDNSEFEIEFRYYSNSIQRTQLTATPRTDGDSVVFTENLLANRTFSYWYFSNSLSINSVNLNHVRTATTISNFDVNNSKYYFSESALANDVFIATVDYDPNWVVSHTTVTNNGTYTRIRIDYKADLSVSNVSIVIDLLSAGIYNENWSLSATQSIYDYNLIIPGINFTSSTQTIYIEGNSSVPYTSFLSFENEDHFTIAEDDYSDISEYYQGYFSFYKYSQAWLIADIENGWTLDGVHYGTKDLDVNNGYFACTGWGPSISTAYLRLKTNPIDKVERTQTEGVVEYVIYSNLPCVSVNVEFYIETGERFVIDTIDVEGGYFDYVSTYSNEGRDYYEILRCDLSEGKNVIRIEYHILNIWDSAWLLLAAGAALLGFAFIYWGIKHPAFFDRFKFWKRKNARLKK